MRLPVGLRRARPGDALIAEVWADDVRLIAPLLTGEGHRGISEMAATLQQQSVRHAFVRVSGIDVHHRQLRYAWELVGSDGQVAVAGVDVDELGEDGRLQRIVGFFGDPGPRRCVSRARVTMTAITRARAR
jgi:hypothetical protein